MPPMLMKRGEGGYTYREFNDMPREGVTLTQGASDARSHLGRRTSPRPIAVGDHPETY